MLADYVEFRSLFQLISRNPSRMDDPSFIKRANNIFRDRKDLNMGDSNLLA